LLLLLLRLGPGQFAIAALLLSVCCAPCPPSASAPGQPQISPSGRLYSLPKVAGVVGRLLSLRSIFMLQPFFSDTATKKLNRKIRFSALRKILRIELNIEIRKESEQDLFN